MVCNLPGFACISILYFGREKRWLTYAFPLMHRSTTHCLFGYFVICSWLCCVSSRRDRNDCSSRYLVVLQGGLGVLTELLWAGYAAFPLQDVVGRSEPTCSWCACLLDGSKGVPWWLYGESKLTVGIFPTHKLLPVSDCTKAWHLVNQLRKDWWIQASWFLWKYWGKPSHLVENRMPALARVKFFQEANDNVVHYFKMNICLKAFYFRYS